MLSLTEENYLKEIYHLSEGGSNAVGTSNIAEAMNTAPASTTDMIKRLAGKKMLLHQKYQGVHLSENGKFEAVKLIRKHRLWESFLVNKLKFNWDEVHEVAEQLEHIKSSLLIQRLDEFLGKPKIDPHGDPIPDENGIFPEFKLESLSSRPIGYQGTIAAVGDSSSDFLQYLDKIGVGIGTEIGILDKVSFDGSTQIQINSNKNFYISKIVGDNLLLT